jgi:hypothetical protein
MKNETVKIGSWPTPEKPISIEIPVKYLQEFGKDARVVIRHPWTVGIPIPEVFLEKIAKNPKVYRELTKKFEIMLIPK